MRDDCPYKDMSSNWNTTGNDSDREALHYSTGATDEELIVCPVCKEKFWSTNPPPPCLAKDKE